MIVIKVEGNDRILFEKREVKLALRKGGDVVRREARRLIARRAISAAGEFPGYDSGAMSKSIQVKAGSGGGYVKIMPVKTPAMGENFYPAFLYYGSPKTGLAPRGNFMTAALENSRSFAQMAIERALARALIVI